MLRAKRQPNDLGLVVDGLKCFTCFTPHDPNRCLNNFTTFDTKICSSSEYYCKVEKIEISGSIQKFFRGCADKCRPVCKGVKGTGQCVSCCSSDLCNSGNMASRVTSHPAKAHITGLFLISIFLMLHS